MNFDGCALSSGRSSFTDSETAYGVDGAAGWAALISVADAIASVEIGECEASGAFEVGGSTCCSVELKYRAWLGRRKVGGSVEEGTRTSCTARLNALLNIFGLECGLQCQLQELVYKSW